MHSTDSRWPVSPLAMRWWRFDAYEVCDGYVRPRRGARLEQYDPADNAEHGGAADRAYQSLLKLYDDLADAGRLSEHDAEDVTEEGKKVIARWCKRHGLIGILPHRVFTVALAPRWTRKTARVGWEVEQREYIRAADEAVAFSSKDHRSPIGGRSTDFGPEGTPLSPRERQHWRTRRPGVVLYDPHPQRRAWTHERLGETWATFFPDVASSDVETYQYPCPLTDEFWRQYAEPVDEFLRSVSAVWEVFSFLTGAPNEMSMLQALDELRPLVQPAGAVLLLPRPDTFRRVWTSPSLLGWFALCITEDLAEHARARRCRVCKTPFLSSAYQARYCSPRCRKTANMRAYRKGLRKKSRKEPKGASGLRGRKRR